MTPLQRLFVVFALGCLIVFSSGLAMAGEGGSASPLASSPLFTESGFITGFGSASIDEGDYETVLLIWHLGINLDRFFPSLKKHKGNLTFFIEPQVNPVINPEEDFEFGVGLGLQYRYPFTDKVSAYVMGSVGPHYISVVTDDQANGFIFADTIGAGLYIHVTERAALNIGYRFRHMSNCDISERNNGIDSHFGVIGFSVFFN
jgi:hypothetical protein